jgi:hypothetical protein
MPGDELEDLQAAARPPSTDHPRLLPLRDVGADQERLGHERVGVPRHLAQYGVVDEELEWSTPIIRLVSDVEHGTHERDFRLRPRPSRTHGIARASRVATVAEDDHPGHDTGEERNRDWCPS